MSRRSTKTGIRIGASMLVLGMLGAPVVGYSETAGQDRRDDRQEVRDTRQNGRESARDAKQECRKGEEKTRAECRQDKRNTKDEARDAAREKRQGN
jgi:hypothetical protein